jgi:hypothetical protein
MQLSRKITAFLAGAAFLAPLSALADDDPPTPPPVVDETPPPPPAPNPPPPAPAPTTTTVETDGTDVNVGVYTDTNTADDFSYSWRDSRLQSDIGIGVQLGGGIAGFTGDTARDVVTSDVQGLWGVKATIGSHIPIGIDVAYIGTATDVDSLTGFGNGTLVGTTLEAALRWNMLPHYQLNPYIFAGLGYQRYDVTDANFTLSANGMRDEDNSLVVPMGAGLAWRDPSGLTLDAHGTFRANTNSELLISRVNPGEFANMHTWEASANIGFEF